MNCNTTHYRANSSSVPGDPTFDKDQSANYDRMVEVEDSFHKKAAFEAGRRNLPDPERDLYLTIFGADDEPSDPTLHTTLVEAQAARSGVELDWSQNPVTAVLRIIDQGQSDRLRLIAGSLVDMGPLPAPRPTVNGLGPVPEDYGN